MKNLTVDVKIKKENEKEIENGLESIKIDNQNFYKIEHKDSLNVADITTLKNITIVDLLNNIKNRFTQKIITSSIGNELIIVNPFEFYQDHMCAEKMDYYIDESKSRTIMGFAKRQKLDPHIFEFTMKAIYRLVNLGKSQSLIVSGESGAGKTESSKQIMRFIAHFFLKERNEIHSNTNYNLFNRRLSKITKTLVKNTLAKINIGLENTNENIPSRARGRSFISEELNAKHINFIEEKILASNPILESFGNCKTIHNNNSSRFGKFLNIFIDLQHFEIKGCYIKQFLLEKSRVFSPIKKERNFHVFYQVVNGLKLVFTGLNDCDFSDQIKENFGKVNYENYANESSENFTSLESCYEKFFNVLPDKALVRVLMRLFNKEEFNLIQSIPNFLDVKAYKILDTGCYAIEASNDAKNFLETIECFLKTGFEIEEIKAIIKLIIFILLLGNVEFELDPELNSNVHKNICKVTDSSKIYLESACKLINFDCVKFSEENFLFNVLKVKTEEIKTHNTLIECYNSRNTFMKEVFNKIFLFIIGQLNSIFFPEELKRQLKNKNENLKTLNILDIYGYECFEVNNFEQFSINYANEKMHQLYIKNIFKEIQERFKEENLMDFYENVQYTDNIEILELIEKQQNGLLKVLETECNLTKDDLNFLNNLKSFHKHNEFLKNSNLSNENFAIKHTSKQIEYSAKNFITKNIDFVKPIMQNYFAAFPNETFKRILLYETQSFENNKLNAKANNEKLLLNKFKNDLNNLIEDLKSTECCYIHCIKSNENKEKNKFADFFVLSQIRHFGIFDTINLLQNGFCIKFTFKEFYCKYEDVVDFEGKPNVYEIHENMHDIKQLVVKTLQDIFPDYLSRKSEFLLGKSAILMKRSFLDELDNVRKKIIWDKEKTVTRIATRFRSQRMRNRFLKLRAITIKIQRIFKIKKNGIPTEDDRASDSKNNSEKEHKSHKFTRLSVISESQQENLSEIAKKTLPSGFIMDKIQILNLKRTIQKFAWFRIQLNHYSVNLMIKKNKEKAEKEDKIIKIQRWFRSNLLRHKFTRLIDKQKENLTEEKNLKKQAEKNLRNEKILLLQRNIRAFLSMKKIKMQIEKEKRKKAEMEKKLLAKQKLEELIRSKLKKLVNKKMKCCLRVYFNKFKKIVKKYIEKELLLKKQKKEKIEKLKAFLKKLKRKFILKSIISIAKELNNHNKNLRRDKAKDNFKEKEKQKQKQTSPVKTYNSNNLSIITNYNFEIELKSNNKSTIENDVVDSNQRSQNLNNKASLTPNKNHKINKSEKPNKNILKKKDQLKSDDKKQKLITIDTNDASDGTKIDNNKNSIKKKKDFITPRSSSCSHNTESKNNKSYKKANKNCSQKQIFDSNQKSKNSDPNSSQAYNTINSNKTNKFHINNLTEGKFQNKKFDYTSYLASHKLRRLLSKNSVSRAFIESEKNLIENKKEEIENKITKNLYYEKFIAFNDEMDELKFFEDNYLNMLALFPNYHHKINKNDLKSTYNVNTLINLQLKYEKKLLNHNPSLYLQTSYLSVSPYEEPKLHFFTFVLDIDNLTPFSEIYEDTWGATLKDFMGFCAANKNPIQIIEISGINTMLVSASGKVFSWGWGLKNKNCFKNTNYDQNNTENDFEIEFAGKDNLNRGQEHAILKESDDAVEKDVNNHFINETHLNLNLNTHKDMSIEYIEKDLRDECCGYVKNNSISKAKNKKQDKYANAIKNTNNKNKYHKTQINNEANVNNSRINKIIEKHTKVTPNSLKYNTNFNNSKNKQCNKISSNDYPNYETNLFSANSKKQKNDFLTEKTNELNLEEEIYKTFNPVSKNRNGLGSLNSRNSDMMLDTNFLNPEIIRDMPIAEVQSPTNNSRVNFLCNSNEVQKEEKLSIHLNTNNVLTFYDKNSKINFKNEDFERNENNQGKEIDGKLNCGNNKKKDLDKFFKKDFDFKINIESAINIENKQEIKIHETKTNEVNEDANVINLKLSSFENECEKKKEKMLQQIFNLNLLNEETFLTETKKAFDYTKFPTAIENINCKSICNSEDFTLLIPKTSNSICLMGNNELNNLVHGKNIFLNAPVDYFENIKAQFTLDFEALQNNPNTTPEDFTNLFEIADEVAKTFFNKMKIADAKSYGKGFIFLNDKGQAFCTNENFCDNLMQSIPIPLNFNSVKFTQVECGKDFCLFLSNTGQIYSQGDNKYGQLGLGDYESRSAICEIPNIKESGIKTVQISCGYKHVVIRSSNNKVFTWGNNSYGQLGNGNFEHSPFPCLMEIIFNELKLSFLQVSAGLRSTCIMSDDRKIFWCGTNGDLTKQTIPIEFRYKEKIPEIFSFDNNQIIKLHHSWSNNRSVFYTVVTDIMFLKTKLKNMQKIRYILNTLSSEWVTKDIFVPCEKIKKSYHGYIAKKHLPK